MDREEQIRRIEAVLSHIEVPAQDGFPEIDIQFATPMERVAAHLYDACGVRVVDVEE